MTMDITLEAPGRPGAGPAAKVAAGANRGASYLVASGQVAIRTLKQFVRTPALIIAGTAQGCAVPPDLPLRLRRARSGTRGS